jgi:hypothetical protein
MDEFNISSLSEAKGEYSVRLVNILTPLVLEGIKSIFESSKKLCIQNNEYDKYLMTFQNLLSRVVNWNESIIQEEINRIVRKSQCNYIPELISSVHITQVKILTSVKLGNSCKKISIDIPTINKFMHNIYIKTARKIYSNVYLFEENVLPLNYQKNMRECEMIIQQCILDTIRDGLPVETILRAYLNDIDEDVEEEVEAVQTTIKSEEKIKEQAKMTKPAASTAAAANSNSNTAGTGETKKVIGDPSNVKILNSGADINQKLSFNNTDKVLDMGTNKENDKDAPKDVNTLEILSDKRHTQRLLDEEEDDDDDSYNVGKLSISDKTIKLDEVFNLDEGSSKNSLIKTSDIEILR